MIWIGICGSGSVLIVLALLVWIAAARSAAERAADVLTRHGWEGRRWTAGSAGVFADGDDPPVLSAAQAVEIADRLEGRR